jgi:hypothetical protein
MKPVRDAFVNRARVLEVVQLIGTRTETAKAQRLHNV